jgi:hypothetical protein
VPFGTDSAAIAQRRSGTIMANDEEWVEDVRRWSLMGFRDGRRPDVGGPDLGDEIDVGYEAAHPALQARHWPDAPTTDR